MTAVPPAHGNDCATFVRYTSSMTRWTLRQMGSVHVSRTGTPSAGSPYSRLQASLTATMTWAAPMNRDMTSAGFVCKAAAPPRARPLLGRVERGPISRFCA